MRLFQSVKFLLLRETQLRMFTFRRPVLEHTPNFPKTEVHELEEVQLPETIYLINAVEANNNLGGDED